MHFFWILKTSNIIWQENLNASPVKSSVVCPLINLFKTDGRARKIFLYFCKKEIKEFAISSLAWKNSTLVRVLWLFSGLSHLPASELQFCGHPTFYSKKKSTFAFLKKFMNERKVDVQTFIEGAGAALLFFGLNAPRDKWALPTCKIYNFSGFLQAHFEKHVS